MPCLGIYRSNQVKTFTSKSPWQEKFIHNKSSPTAVLAASSDWLGTYGYVQVSTLISHHQLQYLLLRQTGQSHMGLCKTCCLVRLVRDLWVCASFNSNKSSSAAVLAASSDWSEPHGSVQDLLPRQTG